MTRELQFQPLKKETALNFVRLLKACAAQKDLAKGSILHAYIRQHKVLENNPYIASTLVNMYAKCGALAKAQQVFNELPVQDVVTWNALIAGYAQLRQGEEALKCYDTMQFEGHFPNPVTFTCALKACRDIGADAKGEEIHDRIASLGMLEKNLVLGSMLVDMYAKCGALHKARQVLEELPIRDVAMWNVLIDGYAQMQEGEEALNCYDRMQREGYSPDAVTFSCALKACGSIRAAAKAKQIHEKIVSLGILEKDIVLGGTLADVYVKCALLNEAQQVADELPFRDVVIWSALIAGYAQHGQGKEALRCYDRMQCEGHSPNAVTFTCALKACGMIGAAAKGEQVHAKIVSLGILEQSNVLGGSLVDMYAKVGALAKAQQVLEELPFQNVVTWSALIAGYVQQEQGEDALKCYEHMQNEGHCPDEVTFICALKACGSIGATVKGKCIHEKIASLGVLEKNVVLGNALIDMYAKCGALAKAQQVLEELPVRDVVTWNALIVGYAQQGQGEQALKSFNSMWHEGHSPNSDTFTCILRACGSIGTAPKGEKIHGEIVNLGLLERDIILGSTLVDMYTKCGELLKAERVLKELPIRNLCTWNALIAGYAWQGQGKQALKCFGGLQQHEGISPDSVTFICALKACGSL